jgi:FkbM family methyltransferase
VAVDLLKHCWGRFREPPTTLLMLGAHKAYEVQAYVDLGIERAVWVEGNPELISDLRARVEPHGHEARQALLYCRSGVPLTLGVTTNDAGDDQGGSASIFPRRLHAAVWPTIKDDHNLDLESVTVDALLRHDGLYTLSFDLLVLDLQGAEVKALLGATALLGCESLKYICTEVSGVELWKGGAQINELAWLLGHFDFTLIGKVVGDGGVGDVLFAREGTYHADS